MRCGRILQTSGAFLAVLLFSTMIFCINIDVTEAAVGIVDDGGGEQAAVMPKEAIEESDAGALTSTVAPAVDATTITASSSSNNNNSESISDDEFSRRRDALAAETLKLSEAITEGGEDEKEMVMNAEEEARYYATTESDSVEPMNMEEIFAKKYTKPADDPDQPAQYQGVLAQWLKEQDDQVEQDHVDSGDELNVIAIKEDTSTGQHINEDKISGPPEDDFKEMVEPITEIVKTYVHDNNGEDLQELITSDRESFEKQVPEDNNKSKDLQLVTESNITATGVAQVEDNEQTLTFEVENLDKDDSSAAMIPKLESSSELSSISERVEQIVPTKEENSTTLLQESTEESIISTAESFEGVEQSNVRDRLEENILPQETTTRAIVEVATEQNNKMNLKENEPLPEIVEPIENDTTSPDNMSISESVELIAKNISSTEVQAGETTTENEEANSTITSQINNVEEHSANEKVLNSDSDVSHEVTENIVSIEKTTDVDEEHSEPENAITETTTSQYRIGDGDFTFGKRNEISVNSKESASANATADDSIVTNYKTTASSETFTTEDHETYVVTTASSNELETEAKSDEFIEKNLADSSVEVVINNNKDVSTPLTIEETTSHITTTDVEPTETTSADKNAYVHEFNYNSQSIIPIESEEGVINTSTERSTSDETTTAMKIVESTAHYETTTINVNDLNSISGFDKDDVLYGSDLAVYSFDDVEKTIEELMKSSSMGEDSLFTTSEITSTTNQVTDVATEQNLASSTRAETFREEVSTLASNNDVTSIVTEVASDDDSPTTTIKIESLVEIVTPKLEKLNNDYSETTTSKREELISDDSAEVYEDIEYESDKQQVNVETLKNLTKDVVDVEKIKPEKYDTQVISMDAKEFELIDKVIADYDGHDSRKLEEDFNKLEKGNKVDEVDGDDDEDYNDHDFVDDLVHRINPLSTITDLKPSKVNGVVKNEKLLQEVEEEKNDKSIIRRKVFFDKDPENYLAVNFSINLNINEVQFSIPDDVQLSSNRTDSTVFMDFVWQNNSLILRMEKTRTSLLIDGIFLKVLIQNGASIERVLLEKQALNIVDWTKEDGYEIDFGHGNIVHILHLDLLLNEDIGQDLIDPSSIEQQVPSDFALLILSVSLGVSGLVILTAFLLYLKFRSKENVFKVSLA